MKVSVLLLPWVEGSGWQQDEDRQKGEEHTIEIPFLQKGEDGSIEVLKDHKEICVISGHVKLNVPDNNSRSLCTPYNKFLLPPLADQLQIDITPHGVRINGIHNGVTITANGFYPEKGDQIQPGSVIQLNAEEISGHTHDDGYFQFTL